MVTALKWMLLAGALLALLVVPYLLWGDQQATWTAAFLASAKAHAGMATAGIIALLAVDVVLPVPSSLVNTAAGFLLGFPGGALASWAGLQVGCGVGYLLGRLCGSPLVARCMGPAAQVRLEALQRRHGDWMVVVARAIPVLAEASIIVAGAGRMPARRFFLYTTLANLGIAATYAAVGAWAASVNSFLLALTAALLIPACVWLWLRRC